MTVKKLVRAMKPDHDIIIRFMMTVRDRGPWTLHGLHPDRVQLTVEQAERKGVKLDPHVQRMPTNTFSPASAKDMCAWVDQWNATHGIYFTANPSRRQAWGRRASGFRRKDCDALDVAAFQYVPLDLDPPSTMTPEQWERQVRVLLGRLDLKPTIIWRSGYGMQCMFRIKPAVDLVTNNDVREAKRVCQGVAEMVHQKLGLESDAVQSVEHIFRLAGTLNHPNATKRAKGRTAMLAGDFTFNPGATYDVSTLPKAAPKAKPLTHNLSEPPGGWDTPDNISNGIMHCQYTRDLAAEGKSQTAWRTALWLRDLGVSVDAACQIMAEHWAPRCDYDWEPDELNDKFDAPMPAHRMIRDAGR